MSNDPDANRAATAERLMERLSGFASGIGIPHAHARAIIVHAIADEPSAAVGDIENKARVSMLNAVG